MLNCFAADCCGVPPSITCTVKLDVPIKVGVPVICPLLDRASPAGSTVLFASDHVYGAVPPLATNVAEYAWLCTPLGNDVVPIVNGVACTLRVVLPLTDPCAAVMIELPP